MPDIYATITETDSATAEQVAGAMELRAADPQQRAFLQAYLAELDLPAGARVLEIGCGTGAIARELSHPDVSFDAVVLHTVLSHVPQPERVLGEAFRVLRPGGRLAVFDGAPRRS